jgi:hypothetical protein
LAPPNHAREVADKIMAAESIGDAIAAAEEMVRSE